MVGDHCQKCGERAWRVVIRWNRVGRPNWCQRCYDESKANCWPRTIRWNYQRAKKALGHPNTPRGPKGGH